MTFGFYPEARSEPVVTQCLGGLAQLTQNDPFVVSVKSCVVDAVPVSTGGITSTSPKAGTRGQPLVEWY